MAEDVIFGDEEEEDGTDSQDSKPEEENEKQHMADPSEAGAEEQKQLDSKQEEPEEEQEESDSEEDSEEDSNSGQQTMNGQSVQENLEERAVEKTVTLGAVSSSNMSIMRAEDETWIPFSSELSTVEKSEMEERLSKLQQNKEVWNGPIQIKMVNRGTMEEPRLRFIEYKIPDSDEVPDDFEPAEREDQQSQSKGSSSSSSSTQVGSVEEVELGSVDRDKAIAKLNKVTGGDYSLTTEIVSEGVNSDKMRNIMKANLEINGNQFTGHGTDEDSQMDSQLLEVAETRAVKRAIINSGVLNRGGQ
jgi:hypothetical protein